MNTAPAEPENNAPRVTERSGATPTPVEVESIPSALTHSLATAGGSMLLLGAAGLAYGCRSAMSPAWQITALSLVPCVLWGGYLFLAKRHRRVAEAEGVLACLTWLVLLLIAHCADVGLPLWGMSTLFIIGAAGVMLLRPNRASFIMMTAASAAEVFILQSTEGAQGLMIPATLVLLQLWTMGGIVCGRLGQSIYVRYAVCGPLALGFYLPLYLWYTLGLPPETPAAVGNLWLILLLGILPAAAAVPFHCVVSKSAGNGGIGAALVLWGFTALSLPACILLHRLGWVLPGGIWCMLYAAAIIRYGATSRLSYAVSIGSAFMTLAAVATAWGACSGFIGTGIILMLLGTLTTWFTLRLYRRRSRLQQMVVLAQQRQQHATETAAAHQTGNTSLPR